jgi:hypothetical protein
MRASLPVRHLTRSAERAAALVGLAGLAGSALATDDHGAHAELVPLGPLRRPVMVEIDCGNDTIDWIVALPGGWGLVSGRTS